jgi:hypothetical protein
MEDEHMKLTRTIIKAAGLIVMASGLAVSQQNDITAQLSKLLDANAKGYIEPLASGLGAGINSGFYHSADLHSVLGFDIGVKVGLAMIADEHKSFDFALPNQIKFGAATFNAGTDYDQVVTGSPTFAGSTTGKPVIVKSTSPQLAFRGQTIFTTPGGFDYSRLPLFAPQAAIGLPFGIEVIGRFLPSTNLGNAGKVNFVGFGLRHDIDQYIPFCPVDLAIHFMTQKVTVNDKSDKKVMSLSGTAFGAEVSKSLILFTVYGGFQFESSSLSLEKYNYTDPTTGLTAQVNGFSIDGANKTRFLAGIRLLLAVINIHADYSFSKYPVATAGVGITFR